MISITVTESPQLKANLASLHHFARTAPMKRLRDVGNELLRLSQREVPHDKGSLQNSGNVQEIGGDIVVGYHKPYAARLHEHPEFRFQKGRKGKYLEEPLIRNLPVFLNHLGKDLETDIRRAIK